MSYYLARSGTQTGPHSIEALRTMVAKGEIDAADLLWQPGQAEWVRADEIPGILLPQPLIILPNSAPHYEQPSSSILEDSIRRVALDIDQLRVDSTTSDRSARKGNWIGRHWRGDLPLPVSYWVMGTLFTIVLTFAMAFFNEFFKTVRLHPRETGLVIISVWTVVGIVTIWQFTGIWRSAGRHPGRGGSAFWAGLAKVMVVFGIISSLGAVSKDWALIAEGGRLLVGIDNIPAHQIRILRDGKEIELSGGIGWGTVDDIRSALDANPSVTVIHLNSVGGRINEAQDLHDLIRSKGLNTYTATGCLSACTLAYLAGRERYLSTEGKIGFHSTAIVGDDVPYGDLNDQVSVIYRDHGLPSDFVAKAIAMKPSDMWYPTHDELIAAKVVTAIVDGRYYGTSGIQEWSDAHKIEEGLLKNPTFAALSQHDPKNYALVSQIFVDGIQKGRSSVEIEADARKIVIDKLVPQYLKVGPDAELLAYWRIQMNEIHFLKDASATKCVQFLMPDPSKPPLDLVQLLPKDMMADDVSALAALIIAAATKPVPVEDWATVQTPFNAVLVLLTLKNPKYMEVLQDFNAYKGEDELKCDTLTAFYDEILNYPAEADRGRILRGLMAQIP